MAGPPAQVDVQSLDDYLEVMSKAVFQSGISWEVVQAKWDTTREAFHDFDVNAVANMTPFDVEALAQDTRVIRHRRKLDAVVHNARQMQALDEEYGSFQDYLRAHGDFDATLKAMKRDFKYMGPTGVYYFLYVVKEPVPPHEEFEAQYRK
jgi:DNA-3-methyladenine glycosylase I